MQPLLMNVLQFNTQKSPGTLVSWIIKHTEHTLGWFSTVRGTFRSLQQQMDLSWYKEDCLFPSVLGFWADMGLWSLQGPFHSLPHCASHEDQGVGPALHVDQEGDPSSVGSGSSWCVCKYFLCFASELCLHQWQSGMMHRGLLDTKNSSK